MLTFLLNLAFSAVASLANLLSFVVLRCSAFLLVIAIQGLKFPGGAIHGVLDFLAGMVKWVVEYAVEFLMEAASSVISSGFELLTEIVTGSVGMTSSAVVSLAEMTKTAFENGQEMLPEVLEGAVEMIGTIVSNTWENCVDAFGYIQENV
ncbi:hypothetical protein H6P81_012182 [Aristolochia fimbriata]|uniref:Uncharacterized protein n=1 Tax=Aristolochia fimbriata TaxID=158543 RepID=A0AAV7EBM6_ARIFI|nr:hypothetical protein H6P81_012182 [Aristolochia fimbriata]